MRRSSRTPSTSPSPNRRPPLSQQRRSSHNAQGPPPADDAQGDVFPPAGTTALSRTWTSCTDASAAYSNRRSSITGSDGGRPSAGRERLPSIRLRRIPSNSTAQAPSQPLNTPRLGLPSSSTTTTTNRMTEPTAASNAHERNRPRSLSQPDPVALPPPNANIARNSQRNQQNALPRLTEEGARPSMAELNMPQPSLNRTTSMPGGDTECPHPDTTDTTRPTRRRRLSRLLRPGPGRRADTSGAPAPAPAPAEDEDLEYHDDLVDFLDIVDPEIQTLSTLTNLQNSLFVPDLGNWVNRRPAYSLSQYLPAPPVTIPTSAPPSQLLLEEAPQETQLDRIPTVTEPLTEAEGKEMPNLQRSNTITSQLSDSHYAALPHGMSLEGWTDQEKRELDDHVRHMLHSRRARFKRTLKGFGQYVRRPLGFFVTLYAVLITLFGLAWVLFLIGWIYVGDHQVYAIHIIDSVLVALFAIMGDGLAPFRVVDTYHMAFIVHHSRKAAKAKRKFLKANPPKQKAIITVENANANEDTPPKSADGAENALVPPPLSAVLTQNRLVRSESDSDSVERILTSTGNAGGALPPQTAHVDVEPTLDLEMAEFKDMEDTKEEEEKKKKGGDDKDEEIWLTSKQLKSLRHHQKKLSRSHSFYKPHPTFTHNAFPLRLLVAIVLLCDLHSCLQISLGATTWGIDYHHRNPAITTTILCVSITTNLVAGLLITMGDKRTRKKDVVALLERQELTTDAIKHLEVKRAKEASRSHDVGTEENKNKGERALVADT